VARTRFSNPSTELPLRELPASALRAVFREGYGRADLRADLLAGLVVGVVALPLAMALAIAVGVPPQHGLYTAIVAGAVVAALGGSRLQVSGPTAAFIAILVPIHAKFGLSGLLVSGLLAGLILLGMGLLRLGKLIQFIPHPVTTGFTAGIAVVIATLQLKDLLGLELASTPEHFFDRLGAFWAARGTFSPWELLVGLLTLALLLTLPKLTKRVPAPLIALPLSALFALALAALLPGADVATIATRFHYEVGGQLLPGIPRLPPAPVWPWLATVPGEPSLSLDWTTFRALLPGAFAIAILGAIESLLSAVIADGVKRTQHDPDSELLALGVGNVVAPFLGGIAATGAIARTAMNIRSGGRSPISALVHAATVLAAVLALAPLLGYLPMAALAALLLQVAWNISEAKHFAHTVRVAPRSDAAVLISVFVLTVVLDMVVGVTVGIVLAALLFMKRMAAVTQAHLVEENHPALPGPVPRGVIVYDISGPLFFGAAQKAMSALAHIGDQAKAVVLELDEVHAMDATGLVALESALDQLARRRILAVLEGVQEQPLGLLQRAGVDRHSHVRFAPDLVSAIAIAKAWADRGPQGDRRSAPDAAA
jgi:sulfate permease, SulP family